MEKPTYGLIGRGRVATHMARYLKLEAQPFLSWHRGEAVAPEEALADADIVLLAISDDALASFLADHPNLQNRPTVHFSGSLTLEGAHGFHPLMTFGPESYDLESYRTVPFVIEEGGLRFYEVFPALRNPSWLIDPELKPLYHALCVLAGNFTTMLWAKAFDGFEQRLGLPREVLEPYLDRTRLNIAASGRDALTGSLARGDRWTVERDLRALEGDSYHEVYRAFIGAFDKQEAGQ